MLALLPMLHRPPMLQLLPLMSLSQLPQMLAMLPMLHRLPTLQLLALPPMLHRLPMLQLLALLSLCQGNTGIGLVVPSAGWKARHASRAKSKKARSCLAADLTKSVYLAPGRACRTPKYRAACSPSAGRYRIKRRGQ